MSNYDFQTLNDKDFEEIARDLLNRKLDLALQNFRKGRDKGIDLRVASSSKSNSIIVQAKHYYQSGYKLLLSSLKKEVIKVNTIAPDRYIIVTSVPLTPGNQTEIKNLFTPFILTENDVIGNETLNAWLEEYPEIEKTHFKLWMSSIKVIETIVNRAVIGRTSFYTEEIKSKISLYVYTQNYSSALKILHDKRALIISGEPGIGKSTLADILCLRLMSDGYSLYKIEDIKEGEDAFSFSNDEKQLFYFDDFLGSIYLELALTGNKTDSQLNNFIQRVRKIPNKLLIFTTRTVILNQAFTFYEKFKMIYSEKEAIEIKLEDYNNYEKALILYNHLYFRKLKENLLDVFYDDELYLKIVKHNNYNPRIIDFISEPSKIEMLSGDQYKNYILNTLQNPSGIWDLSFKNQINDEQRFLLFTLFTFKENIAEEDCLQETYNSRIEFETSINGHIRSANSFLNSLRILLNGFIVRRVIHDGIRQIHSSIGYINPSLGDYIKNYLVGSEEERLRMLSSFIYIEQYEKINAALKGITRSSAEFAKSYERLVTLNCVNILNTLSNDTDIVIKKCRCLFDISSFPASDLKVTKLFETINLKSNLKTSMSDLFYILKESNKNQGLYQFIQTNFTAICERFLKSINEYDDYVLFQELFTYYSVDYSEYMRVDSNRNFVASIFQYLFDNYKDEKVSELKDSISSMDEANELETELENIAQELQISLFEGFDAEIDINYSVQWERFIDKNYKGEGEPDFDYESRRDHQTFEKNSDNEIRNLFDRE